MTRHRGRRRRERGQGMVEYVLVLALVAMVVAAMVQIAGRATAGAMCKVSNALAQGGHVYGTGRNDMGQLGIGSFGGPYNGSSYTTPQEAINICGGTLTAGANAVGVIGNDGAVYLWGGTDGYGVFGPNAPLNANQATPVKLPLPAADGSAVGLALGDNNGEALMSDGAVYTWGDDLYGQLGNGTWDSTTGVPHATPVKVLGLPPVTAIAAGFGTDFAVTAAGTVYGWGDNAVGELANGTYASVTSYAGGLAGSPAACNCSWFPSVVGISGIRSLAIQDQSWTEYAIMADGSVDAWGTGADGELGNNTNGYANTPVKVLGAGCDPAGLQNIVQLAADQSGALALDTSGNVYAWGKNSPGTWTQGGMLGDGTLTDRLCPVHPLSTSGLAGTTLQHVSLIGTSLDGSYAEIGGQMYTWGSDLDGELGYTTATNTQLYPRAATVFPPNVIKMAGSYEDTLVLYPPQMS